MKQNQLLTYYVFATSFFLGLFFTGLFFHQSVLGLSVPLLIGVIILFAIAGESIKNKRFLPKRIGILYLLTWIASLASIFSQNERVAYFSLFFTLVVLFFLGIYQFWDVNITNFSFRFNMFLYAKHYLSQFSGLQFLSVGIFDSVKNNDVKKLSRGAGKIIIGAIIAIPFLFLFFALFAAADQLFLEISGDLIPSLNISIGDFFLIWGSVSFISFWILIGYAFGKTSRTQETLGIFQSFLDPGVTVVTSILVNLLFLLFVITQFVYLFGGQKAIEKFDLIYSDYAVRGFNEMVMITLLSIFFIYVISIITHPKKSTANIILQVSLLINVLFNFVIIISSYARIGLYVDTYGLTEDRLYTFIAQIFAALLFIFILIALSSDTAKFFVNKNGKHKQSLEYLSLYMMIVLLLITIVTGIINPDSTITRYNINRYRNIDISTQRIPEATDLDVDYLLSLSSDSYFHVIDAANNGEFCYANINLIELKANGNKKKTLGQHFRHLRFHIVST